MFSRILMVNNTPFDVVGKPREIWERIDNTRLGTQSCAEFQDPYIDGNILILSSDACKAVLAVMTLPKPLVEKGRQEAAGIKSHSELVGDPTMFRR